ncbi:MAG TPA: hypothetical protein PKV48_04685, partial [Thermodesulfobacteriota bacterium]|nr:hypothetical protein [Thermodesulfobacteriota bacterium]
MMRKKGLIILFSFALVGALSLPAWAAYNVPGVCGSLEIGGYIRNMTDVRAASPNDVMRCETSAALRFDYKPTTVLQFYLELRPFVDAAMDMGSNALSRHNRGIMGIDKLDYGWRAKTPHYIGMYGTDTEVGGWVRHHDVLSTNMNTSYWRYNSFFREGWALWKSP